MAASIEANAASEPGSEDNNVFKNTKRIKILNLGPIVNYKGIDYAPTVSADGKTLYFVSDRPGSKMSDDNKPSHDFWAAKKENRMDTAFQAPFNIDLSTTYGDRGVNTKFNEGAASIAADKQSLYFTACSRADGLGGCDIYKTTVEGDQWGLPMNLGPSVNSKYWDSQPSISPDQKRLYFISTRPGPNSNGDPKSENMDIWYSDWDDNSEEWKPAVNLTELNTSDQEFSPFIAADNQTLFFASNGHKPNIGGLDFYYSKMGDAGKWGAPVNLGEPINTKEDEMFLALPASGDIIYFASKRKDIAGYQGDFDLFMAFVPSFFKAVNVKVQVVDECTQENIPAHLTIKNPVTGKKIEDSVTINKKEFEMVVSNQDYGNPKDSLPFVNLDISANNPKYGSAVKIQRVDRPSITYKKEEMGAIADEINIKISLGQRPLLGTKIGEADYVRRYKSENPTLAQFNGLVMEQILTWDLYPLLNYVFFDQGSSELPKRYKLFSGAAQTKSFADTTIPGGTLDKYYHILNIYGFRLNKNPNSKVEIVGCNDGTTAPEKKSGLSKERAYTVYNYLKNVWNIDESRMKLTFRDKPEVVSNLKDSLGIVENRRVEIKCSDWEIMKPVFQVDTRTVPEPDTMEFTMQNGIDDQIVASRRIEVKRGDKTWKTFSDIGKTTPIKMWDWTNDDLEYPKDEAPYKCQLIVTSNSGNECKSDIITIPVKQVKASDRIVGSTKDSTAEKYNLILFPFDKSDAGPINERIMKDYVYDRVKPTSKVTVVGHTDVVGLEDHNQKLSERRSGTVKDGIDKKTSKQYSELNSQGVGEDTPLYPNELPEGRFYNRTVQVLIRTPLSEYEKKK
jgi:outer membrane protein OmpA-like peptidoglycan-associated protein